MIEELRKLVEAWRVAGTNKDAPVLWRDAVMARADELEAILARASEPERKCRCGRTDCLPSPQYAGIDGDESGQAARERLGHILSRNPGLYYEVTVDDGFVLRDSENIAVAARGDNWADACTKACEAFEKAVTSIKVTYGDLAEAKEPTHG